MKLTAINLRTKVHSDIFIFGCGTNKIVCYIGTKKQILFFYHGMKML